MTMISYSAPAKIILSGEHSVTYGKPALVTAINLRLHATIENAEETILDPRIEKAISFIEDVVIHHLEKIETIKRRPFKLTINSEIPEGRGMGSSAAFCVAVSAALLEFYSGTISEKSIVNSLAYQSEKFFHGFPSGVDVSASCIGGLIFYRKEFEFLKTISSLNFKIPHNIQRTLWLLDSGMPSEPTSEMIKIVGQRYNKHPKEMEHTIAEIEKCTKRMVVSIVKEDIHMFQETIKENQHLLYDLGIVSEKTNKLLSVLEQIGSGKVTGAGGVKNCSGMILFSALENEITRELEEHKIPYFAFQQDFDGLRREAIISE